ncbi:MAG: hypothetical protein QM763_00095 [Agriterribacter sp.]
MIVYDYIYYHFFELVSKYKKVGARESALLYISVIIYFLTLPFAMVSLISLFKVHKIFFFILGLIYAWGIYFLNKRYFERTKKIKAINQRFRGESTLQRRIGYVMVILLLLSSFVLFFVFLSML